MGRVEGIFVWPVSKGDPRVLTEVEAVAGVGLAGDRKRSKKRQMTVLAAEDWAAASREVGNTAEPMWRRANLVVTGIASLGATIGSRLQIGEVVLEVLGETDPCHRMDDVWPGLRAALEPACRGGVHGAIVRGGKIRVGDEVQILPAGDALTPACETHSASSSSS